MRPTTLAEAARRLATQTLEKAIPEFLDAFYAEADPDARRAMFAEEPPLTGSARQDAMIGAIAEYLIKQYILGDPPAWSNAPCRKLDEPWHTTSSTSPVMIEYLTFASPAEFRRRNIFTEERPLRRAGWRPTI